MQIRSLWLSCLIRVNCQVFLGEKKGHPKHTVCDIRILALWSHEPIFEIKYILINTIFIPYQWTPQSLRHNNRGVNTRLQYWCMCSLMRFVNIGSVESTTTEDGIGIIMTNIIKTVWSPHLFHGTVGFMRSATHHKSLKRIRINSVL